MLRILNHNLALIFVFTLFYFATPTCASPQKVYFAGFAFLSDYSDISHEYPYSQKVETIPSDTAKSNRIDAAIRKKIASISNPNIDILVDELGDSRLSDALSLALVLDWEDVCIEQLESDVFKTVLNLHAQILVFDFDTNKIILTHPFGVRVTDASKSRPDEKHIQNQFNRLYFEKIGKINFLDEFTSLLNSIEIKNADDNRLKVTAVNLDAKALEYMPEKEKKNQTAYKNFVAQQFSSFLAANQGVSVLPFTAGHAIQSKMALRFGNGTALDLDIPEADIPIEITVRGFKKVKMDENHTGSSWAYGSFINLKVLDPWGDPVVDTKFKNASVKIITKKAQITPDSDWTAYQESLLKLFQDLTMQISERSSSWISKRTKDKSAKSQLAKLEDLLNKNKISLESFAQKK